MDAGRLNVCQLRRPAWPWELQLECGDRRSQNQLLIKRIRNICELRFPSSKNAYLLKAIHTPTFVLLTFNIVQSSEDFHAAILVSCSTSALQAAIKAVIIRRPFAV